MPGEEGNFELAGHSSTYYTNQVFNEVHKVKVGDKIKIKTVNDEFTYTITSLFSIFSSKDVKAFLSTYLE